MSCGLRCHISELPSHQRMDGGLQGETGLGVLEDPGRHLGVIHPSLLVEHLGAEEGSDGRRSFASRLVQLRHDLVGVHHPEAGVAQPLGHGGFAAGQAAGESDAEGTGAHGVTGSPWRRRAAFKVPARTMATVSGPTPPGTGVMWDAFGETWVKSTSPTRV